MPNIHTQNAVTRFVQTLGAELYDIRLIDATTQARKHIKVSYIPSELSSLETMRYLAYMNKERYHIYCRPIGYQYIFLDDLTKEKLQELSKFKPCLLLESSKENYQAWLKLEEAPESRELAKDLCRKVATYLGADLNSADPEHVGRLPGYTNCKEKYVNANGQFPYVKLWKWNDRIATFHPLEGAACNNNIESTLSNKGQFSASKDEQVQASRRKNNSQSEIDFAIACQMIRDGKSNFEIESRLEKNLRLPGRTNKTKKYILLTITNARKAVNR